MPISVCVAPVFVFCSAGLQTGYRAGLQTRTCNSVVTKSPRFYFAAVSSAPMAFNRICASRHVEVGIESGSFGFSILR